MLRKESIKCPLLAAVFLPGIQTPKLLAYTVPINGDGSYQSGTYRNLFAECTSRNPKAPSYEFFARSCKTGGTHHSKGAAPDGECYFAMALLFVSNRWVDGKGIYDYHAEAVKLLRAMVNRPVISASDIHGMHTAGPMISEK